MPKMRLLVVPVTTIALLMLPGIAAADTVGTPGTPHCFGKRISHGSSAHKLTPRARAAELQKLVDAGFPPAVALFGATVSVKEMTAFVRANCSDTPVVP